LKSRISQHLIDKHAIKWDRFSLYLVRKVDHIRELESLVMRISDPKGNAAKGRLKHAENLNHRLRQLIKAVQEEDLSAIFKSRVKTDKQSDMSYPERKAVAGKRRPALLGYIRKTMILRATYKGQSFTAKARRTGRIFLGGKSYDSPSAAARVVTGKWKDGWHFWRFRNKKGQWVKIDTLRRK